MLSGKTAVITGASRGIGRAIALQFAAKGAKLALLDMTVGEAAEETAAACRAAGAELVSFYQCNVTDFNGCKDVVTQIKKDFGGVDVLVNNAGITRDGLIATMKEEDFNAVIDTNLVGAFNMIRHCTPLFIRAKSGKVINISSVSGLMGNAGQSNYSASKAGLVGLTKSLARELASRNVTCNAVAPGFMQTDMTKQLDSETNPLATNIPLGRLGTAEDVANVVMFLASPNADYITGEVIRVDGGIAM